jgi:hypothetical protein
VYSLDTESRDAVHALDDVPPSSLGAPLPLVLADDSRLVLAYIVHEPDPAWDGTWTEIVSPESPDALIALVAFPVYYASSFGPPNDDALSGHPLYPRGLRPYGAYEVLRSTWIRRLERMNAVHPQHRPERYASRRHFVFTFHDSTFECVADRFDVSTRRGSLRDSLLEMQRLLGHTSPAA